MAVLVHIRLGRRFFSVWWLPGVGVAVAIVLVVAAKLYFASGVGHEFLARHACIPLSPPVPAGVPAFVRWTHLGLSAPPASRNQPMARTPRLTSNATATT